MKYQFVRSHCDEYPVRVMCRILGIAPSGYYAWCQHSESRRSQADVVAMHRIVQVHSASRGIYGSPKIQQALRQQGIHYGRHRIMRLMRCAGICAKRLRCSKRTTHSKSSHLAAPNLLLQHFVATAPDAIWLADATYIPTQEGWLYLSAVLDLYSRCIVGWAMGAYLNTDLMRKALQMAVRQRYQPELAQPGNSLIHHSDRGSQYTSTDYQKLLACYQITPSMSSTGNCYDNAPMESFFAQLKTELVHHTLYPTRQAAISSIFSYIETFYNRTRIHSALQYRSPLQFKERYFQALSRSTC